MLQLDLPARSIEHRGAQPQNVLSQPAVRVGREVHLSSTTSMQHNASEHSHSYSQHGKRVEEWRVLCACCTVPHCFTSREPNQ
jgi:hypothetical protein